jgi:aarF domain-containing kinase
VTHDGETVAVKIQYPGVADSINSDIDNLVMLLSPFQARLPKQLFLDNVIDFARRELAWECDYDRELTACQRMKEFLQESFQNHKLTFDCIKSFWSA